MKNLSLIAFLAVFISVFVFSFPNRATAAARLQICSQNEKEISATKNKPLVLLELFTAERCPLCPTADRNLTFMETEQPFAEAELITLSLHVDYWNSNSAEDEFSSPMFSRRQSIYGQVFKISSIYTPQMILDGKTQFAGTDLAKAQKAVSESTKNEKGKIELTADETANGGIKLRVKITDLPKHEAATIFLAVAEDNLISKRGANSSPKRIYTSVARELLSLGFLAAEQKNSEIENFFQLQPGWKPENLKLIVFVQENASRKVFGIGKYVLQNKN